MTGFTDRYTVERDGEEIEVFNWVNLTTFAIVRGYNPTVEKFNDEAQIGAGDSSMEPDAVTPAVADELWHEFGIEVEKHGIKVIDPTADEVVE